MAQELIRLDGIKWWIVLSTTNNRMAVPLCPKHNLRMDPIEPVTLKGGSYRRGYKDDAVELECAEGPHRIKLPRKFAKEKSHVINKIDAINFKKMNVINLDDEAIPIAESKVKIKNGKYFVTSKVMETKNGPQVVIYAGECGNKTKSQIFVEPKARRLDFDRNDVNPSEIFVKVEAVFEDGSSHTIKRGKNAPKA